MRLAISLIVVRFVLGFGLCNSADAEESFPRVKTPLGIVEGYYKTTNNGRQFEAYEGIPYARSPSGKLRFEIARKVTPWKGTFNAKEFGPICMRYNPFTTDPAQLVEGSEDCLYLNIYNGVGNDSRVTANGKSTNLLPVIFFIHGGGFRYGSGSEYGPDYLLDEDILLVTINYRLGPLGFLSTEDEIVPGNMGLKDQVMALRWVKDNIESFGGDPSRITLFGHSAGGVSVQYHYLTNLTTGLFQGGMSASGVTLECWSQTENSLEKAKQLAAMVGCTTDDVPDMIDCLKDRPAHQIVRTIGEFTPWFLTPVTPFGPVAEKYIDEFTFMDRLPIEIITSGDAQDLPWMTGIVSEEGLTFAAAFVANDTLLELLNDDWDTIAPYLLDYNYTIPTSDYTAVAELARQHYLGSDPINSSTTNQTVQMISDRYFAYDAAKAAKLQAQANQSPVHFYYFSYRGAHSFSEATSGSTQNFGVAHEDDIAYVLKVDLDTTSTSEDRAMQKKLIDLWVSFAYNNTPNIGVEWPAVNGSQDPLDYMHIAGPDNIAMESSEDFGQGNFWNSIGFRENENAV